MAIPVHSPAPLNTRRPFTRAVALRRGIPVRSLISREFHKVLHGVYISSSVRIDLGVRADAALLVSPRGSWISHSTAARLWGGSVPDDSDVHVTSPGRDGRSVRRGIKAHAAVPAVRPVRRNGMLISSPVQTFLDLASALDLVALVVLGDSLLKSCQLPASALAEAAGQWHGRGAKAARRAARFVREGVDSVKESQLRMLIVLAGVPEPSVNYILRRPDGSWWRRFDLCYPELKLIIEYDGRQHANDVGQWRGDLQRREELDRLGWRIIVVTKEDLHDDPAGVIARVQQALIERGATGIRRRPRTEWIRYFGA